MHFTPSIVAIVGLAFVVGGVSKGVAGMGLPTVVMGLLGLLITPAQAAALVVIPSLVTNVWQFFSGRHRMLLIRRMGSMLLATIVVTWVSARVITGAGAGRATVALGVALMLYAVIGLARVRLFVPRRHEVWLSPLVGILTGIATGATGVFAIPAAPYLQALGFDKDDLVQVLGLSFTTSTIALAAGLATHGAFHVTDAADSVLCTVPALAGMRAGRAIRARVDAETFRVIFLIGLLVLGADLMARFVL